ncbi:MAG: hypothetical protein J0H78_13425 [Rhizobiales bacterium]|nr:hypothetical protein [Hyphomicrobiales bacterium]OJY43521.1 MAG: hypothetical protein BGP08_01745 [Rhizobiales bacterium 64-17]
MAHRLFIALVAGAFACGIGAAHAQQKPGPETHSGQPSSTLSAPTEAPDAQGHDSQTGNPESAHRHAPQPGTDGKASDDKTSGKSADETSGKMDAGTPTPPAK